MEGRITWRADDPDTGVRQVERWRDAGASHLTIDTMRTDRAGVDGHIGAITAAADALLG